MKEKQNKNLKDVLSQLTEEDAWAISWALFFETQRTRKELDEMDCAKCWGKKHPRKSRQKALKRLMKRMDMVTRAEGLFNEFHGIDVFGDLEEV